MAIAKEKKSDYKQVEPGLQQAVCYASWDIGLQKKKQYDTGKEIEAHQIVLAFEVEEKDDNGECMTLSKFYTLSLHLKANLRHDLEGWFGRPLTAVELEGYDTDKLVGLNCMINVVRDDKDKSRIGGIAPLPKKMMPFKPTRPATMPEWVQKIKDRGRPGSEPAEPSMENDAIEPAEVA